MSLNAPRFLWIAAWLVVSLPATHSQVPQAITYQGSLLAGAGMFKFALVNSNGTATFWSNDGSSAGGGEPKQAITHQVTLGLFTVLLGDTNMTPVRRTVFTNSDVRLRIWFNDGTNGFAQLSPDQQLTSSGFAMMAACIPNGSVAGNNLAPAAVSSLNIAVGAVTSAQLALGAVTTPALANGVRHCCETRPASGHSPCSGRGCRDRRQSRARIRDDTRHRQCGRHRRQLGAQCRNGFGHC